MHFYGRTPKRISILFKTNTLKYVTKMVAMRITCKYKPLLMIILTIVYLCKRFNIVARVYSLVLITQIPAVTFAAYFTH